MFKIKLFDRKTKKRLLILAIICLIVSIFAWYIVVWMPGVSYQGQLSSLTSEQNALKTRLQEDIKQISGQGEHNFVSYINLQRVAHWLEESLTDIGYQVHKQQYQIGNKTYRNLEVEIIGKEKPEQIIVIGAHYDSYSETPGANDNGSGAAAVLELARAFYGKQSSQTIRFVEFVNEEPPFFQTEMMGSWVYAHRCQQKGEQIVAMLSLETMGYYSQEPSSQLYPFPLSLFYPKKGNFITFIANLKSRKLLHQVIASFRNYASFPSEGVALASDFPGVGWSDQWSFWQHGYQGIMVTDTAPARYPYYHTPQDTPDKVNYEALARIITGLEGVIKDW